MSAASLTLTTAFVHENLAKAGIVLPELVPALFNYVPYVVSGSHLFIAGQIPVANGKPAFVGKCGADTGMDDGIAAARLCALNILSQVNAAVAGDWSRVVRCVRVGGFDHSKIINGASDLLVEILGDAGRHARAAVGVSSLPLGVPVEVDAIFEII